ncbi:TetR family transcriptional regulator [Actinocorallia libanotica]|uniref:TetR/AcrR family transcriptional regulator n=1 Tax=Actinocorallia libanotica TaxID=46162 RepID=A0ABP4CDG6_9ACTN
MGRPSRFDEDRLLDAAVGLAAGSGPRGVTVAAVARAAGAPSGSVYHRFPGLAALLAALWLRTLERFQDGWLAAMAEAPDAAARYVVAWSRAHPEEARILLHGAAAFDEPNWPAEARERLTADNARVAAALADAAARHTSGDVERLTMVTVDLPYAVVRRHLLATGGLPERAETLAADAAATLLAAAPLP